MLAYLRSFVFETNFDLNMWHNFSLRDITVWYNFFNVAGCLCLHFEISLVEMVIHTHLQCTYINSYCMLILHVLSVWLPYTLFQYSLPLDLISREVFSQWMEIVRAVADRPVPEQTNAVDEEDRVDLPWWKCKKWALHILHRMFERSVSHNRVECRLVVCCNENSQHSEKTAACLS
jgi:hypothetical protein